MFSNEESLIDHRKLEHLSQADNTVTFKTDVVMAHSEEEKHPKKLSEVEVNKVLKEVCESKSQSNTGTTNNTQTCQNTKEFAAMPCLEEGKQPSQLKVRLKEEQKVNASKVKSQEDKTYSRHQKEDYNLEESLEILTTLTTNFIKKGKITHKTAMESSEITTKILNIKITLIC